MPNHQVETQWAGLSTVTLIEHIGYRLRPGIVLCLVATILPWAWLLSGAGMGMRISAMTTWAFPPDSERLVMPLMTWSVCDWALMLFMWSTMMWAMMLPALLLEAKRNRRSGRLSTAFVVQYMGAWTVFSVAATALQFLAQTNGWLDGMRMRSIDPVFSTVLLSIAVLSQLVGLGRARSRPVVSNGWRVDEPTYALRCLFTTAPMMLLLFVGGVMNLVWIVGLTAWAILQKRWRRSRWHQTTSAVVCTLMTIQIWS